MKRTISGLDLWKIATDPAYAYVSPELAETIKANESAQSGESDSLDWVSAQYRRIG